MSCLHIRRLIANIVTLLHAYTGTVLCVAFVVCLGVVNFAESFRGIPTHAGYPTFRVYPCCTTLDDSFFRIRSFNELCKQLCWLCIKWVNDMLYLLNYQASQSITQMSPPRAPSSARDPARVSSWCGCQPHRAWSVPTSKPPTGFDTKPHIITRTQHHPEESLNALRLCAHSRAFWCALQTPWLPSPSLAGEFGLDSEVLRESL